jgi:hypothetical protein
MPKDLPSEFGPATMADVLSDLIVKRTISFASLLYQPQHMIRINPKYNASGVNMTS